MNLSKGRLKRFSSCTGFVILMFTFGAILGTVRRVAINNAQLQIREASLRTNLELNQGIKHYVQSYGSRHLLSDETENCTERGITSFPTIFTNEQRLNGAVVVNILIAIYLCGVIGYICSAYFVPSLEIISERLGLQTDVAGATFMAAGSSAPEFFSAAIGTFISEDDTGLSAVVGSAAFNVFIIISLVSFCSGRVVHITWWPLIRDCLCYVVGILLLVFAMFDGVVEWWEGLILSVMYIGYIILMYFNPILSVQAQEWTNKLRRKDDESKPIVDEVPEQNGNGTSGQNGYGTSGYGTSGQNGYGISGYGTSGQNGYGTSGDGVVSNGHADGDLYETDVGVDNSTSFSNIPIKSNELSHEQITNNSTRKRFDSGISDHPERLDKRVLLSPPEGKLLFFLWLIGFPPILLLYMTIPDCRRNGCWRECYMLTFIMSTVWLAFTSYALYWMIVVIGYTFNIPDTVMGITFLAAGTSVPDAIASVLVARDGFGDMAIANIIGSNIFEIFVCLGFLWFLKASIDAPVNIASDGLTFTSLSLLFTVAFIIILIHFNGWKLDAKMGVICTLTYFVFITIAILRELGILGNVDVPVYCPGPD